jgi:hypothetical protein
VCHRKFEFAFPSYSISCTYPYIEKTFMPRLQRTESLIFETSLKNTESESVNLELIYLSSSSSKNPSASINDNSESAATWVSLPPPPPLNMLPKFLYVQYSSPLGLSPRKLHHRIIRICHRNQIYIAEHC